MLKDEYDMSKDKYKMLYNDTFKEQLTIRLKARIPIIHIDAPHEKRFLHFITLFSQKNNYDVIYWNAVDGLETFGSTLWGDKFFGLVDDDKKNLQKILSCIMESDEKILQNKNKTSGSIYILSDIEFYLNDPVIFRYLMKIHQGIFCSSLLFVSPLDVFPQNHRIRSMISTISEPVPNTEEYMDLISGFSRSLERHEELQKEVDDNPKYLLKLIEGRPLLDAANFFALRIIRYKSIFTSKFEKENYENHRHK